MPPSPYFIWVNSKPIKASIELFEKWYTTEHVPDLVTAGAATRATFYREVYNFPGSVREHHDRSWLSVDQNTEGASEPRHLNYLAAYQTKFKEPFKSEEYKSIPITSPMLPWESKLHSESGDFDARYYELIQDFDPKDIGEVPSPFIVTVECEPSYDADYDAWYRDEHLEVLSKIPVYRRSQRYKLGPLVEGVTIGQPPRFVAIHEVDDVSAFFTGPEFEAAWSDWTKRIMDSSKKFVVRGWENIHSEGYAK